MFMVHGLYRFAGVPGCGVRHGPAGVPATLIPPDPVPARRAPRKLRSSMVPDPVCAFTQFFEHYLFFRNVDDGSGDSQWGVAIEFHTPLASTPAKRAIGLHYAKLSLVDLPVLNRLMLRRQGRGAIIRVN